MTLGWGYVFLIVSFLGVLLVLLEVQIKQLHQGRSILGGSDQDVEVTDSPLSDVGLGAYIHLRPHVD